jgi:hypothetical protein
LFIETDPLDATKRVVIVVDAKAASSVQLSHKIQSTFYVMVLEHLVVNISDLRVVTRAGIWRPTTDFPETFDTCHVRFQLDHFLKHGLCAILHPNCTENDKLDHPNWNYSAHCEHCIEKCRHETMKEQTLSMLPDMNERRRNALMSLLQETNPVQSAVHNAVHANCLYEHQMKENETEFETKTEIKTETKTNATFSTPSSLSTLSGPVSEIQQLHQTVLSLGNNPEQILDMEQAYLIGVPLHCRFAPNGILVQHPCPALKHNPFSPTLDLLVSTSTSPTSPLDSLRVLCGKTSTSFPNPNGISTIVHLTVQKDYASNLLYGYGIHIRQPWKTNANVSCKFNARESVVQTIPCSVLWKNENEKRDANGSSTDTPRTPIGSVPTVTDAYQSFLLGFCQAISKVIHMHASQSNTSNTSNTTTNNNYKNNKKKNHLRRVLFVTMTSQEKRLIQTILRDAATSDRYSKDLCQAATFCLSYLSKEPEDIQLKCPKSVGFVPTPAPNEEEEKNVSSSNSGNLKSMKEGIIKKLQNFKRHSSNSNNQDADEGPNTKNEILILLNKYKEMNGGQNLCLNENLENYGNKYDFVKDLVRYESWDEKDELIMATKNGTNETKNDMETSSTSSTSSTSTTSSTNPPKKKWQYLSTHSCHDSPFFISIEAEANKCIVLPVPSPVCISDLIAYICPAAQCVRDGSETIRSTLHPSVVTYNDELNEESIVRDWRLTHHLNGGGIFSGTNRVEQLIQRKAEAADVLLEDVWNILKHHMEQHHCHAPLHHLLPRRAAVILPISSLNDNTSDNENKTEGTKKEQIVQEENQYEEVQFNTLSNPVLARLDYFTQLEGKTGYTAHQQERNAPIQQRIHRLGHRPTAIVAKFVNCSEEIKTTRSGYTKRILHATLSVVHGDVTRIEMGNFDNREWLVTRIDSGKKKNFFHVVVFFLQNVFSIH